MTTRLPILIRRSQVFEAVVAGKTYDQICLELDVSEDTIARDMAAIGDEVRTLVKERNGEILAVALANLQKVIDCAWAEYDADVKYAEAWHKGELDYIHENVVTKTLAQEGQDGEPPIVAESQALEVKRTQRTVRPPYTSNRAQWLRTIVDTTGQITELVGIKKLLIEHTGKDGKPLLEAFGAAVDKIYGVKDGTES
jgi:hypothetical protein